MQSKNVTQTRFPVYLWVRELDRILRGESTKPLDVHRADIPIPVAEVSMVVMGLAVIYGLCMGAFALVRGWEGDAIGAGYLQTFATMCKVPLLYVLTLVITLPSLYVFNALVGSQLKFIPVLKLMVASIAVNLSVLASLGPIVAFFSFSTPNYGFIVLLNVTVFGVSGVLGLTFLVQTLKRLTAARRGRLMPPPVVVAGVERIEITDVSADEDVPTDSASVSNRPGPLEEVDGLIVGKHVWKVFTVWIFVFGLVGAQMGWVLRPFIGSPDIPFTWFRARDSNFFESVASQLWNLLLGS